MDLVASAGTKVVVTMEHSAKVCKHVCVCVFVCDLLPNKALTKDSVLGNQLNFSSPPTWASPAHLMSASNDNGCHDSLGINLLMGLLNAPLTGVLSPFLMTRKPFVQVRLQLHMSIPTRPPVIAVWNPAKASGSPGQCDARAMQRSVFIESGFFSCSGEPVWCPATEYCPDGAAGGHKFTGLKPVSFLKGARWGGVSCDH